MFRAGHADTTFFHFLAVPARRRGRKVRHGEVKLDAASAVCLPRAAGRKGSSWGSADEVATKRFFCGAA